MGRAMLVLIGVSLLLAACADPGPAQIPGEHGLWQNAPSNQDFQPRNSLPR